MAKKKKIVYDREKIISEAKKQVLSGEDYSPENVEKVTWRRKRQIEKEEKLKKLRAKVAYKEEKKASKKNNVFDRDEIINEAREDLNKNSDDYHYD